MIAVLTLAFSSPADAWDGERKGFLIALGAGIGFTSTAQTKPFVDDGSGRVRGFDPPRDFSPLIGGDFQIGYAPNNNFDLFLFTNNSWMDINIIDPAVVPTATIASFTLTQLNGVGLTYYRKQTFLPSAPAGFVTAGIGVGVVRPSTSSSLPTRYGPGLTFGGGYEFKKHIRTKLAFTYINASKKFSGESFSVIPWSVKLTIGIIGY